MTKDTALKLALDCLEDIFGKNKDAPQREWVGLTDEQIEVIAKNYALGNPTTPLHFARAIEAKLKEKNGG